MDKRLIATRGVPGSGKSTWASEEQERLIAQGLKVVISNKDDLRAAMAQSGWVWTPEAEKDVIKTQNSVIKGAFAQGANVVIVADCNFGRHKDRLRGLAMSCNADFEIKDFTNVPLALCIERDSKRPEGRRVGADAITAMYNEYLVVKEPMVYIPNHKLPRAIICDLDGTLALHNGKRSPYDYMNVGVDDLNAPVAEIIRAFAGYKGYTIIYISGRDSVCRHVTEEWIQKNHCPVDPPHILLMRKEKDHRKDYIVKQEIFDQYVRDNYWVKFVLDDRDQVVKMWRAMGLSCLQVNYGNF